MQKPDLDMDVPFILKVQAFLFMTGVFMALFGLVSAVAGRLSNTEFLMMTGGIMWLCARLFWWSLIATVLARFAWSKVKERRNHASPD